MKLPARPVAIRLPLIAAFVVLLAGTLSSPAQQEATASPPAAAAQSASPSPAASASVAATAEPRPLLPTPRTLIVDLVAVFVFLLVALLTMRNGLERNPDWNLADAVSTEAEPPAGGWPPGTKPIMVASASRLIALFGMFVILAMFLGVGIYVVWALFKGADLSGLDRVVKYFYCGAALFAPYAVNQLKEAFTAFAK